MHPLPLRPRRACAALILAQVLVTVAAASLRADQAPPLATVAAGIVERNEGLWRSCANPTAGLSSRALFAYALALCEARQHPERLDRLFALAAQMQDRDPQSRGYGNFHWYWRDPKVLDYNAVDFCMRAGPLLWLKHRDFIPEAAQPRLRELLALSAQGCLKHKVAESYSNIALMNADDLILLGEVLGQPELADEGYARLDRVYRYTQETGVHEFASPTYTGVDLDDLVVIEAFCGRARGRAQARALLEFLWTDIALNWFPPAQKLAGAHSRTYDYLRGLGYLDVPLALNGWLDGPTPSDADAIFGAEAKWHPPAQLRESSSRYPRLVRQSWGRDGWQSRTHYLLPGITLSSIASAYGGRMDMPLTVDLPGDRKSVRGYFIADGRDDPYGKKKIAAGAHEKAFHLDPFWTAAQRTGDALGLAVYRDKDIPTNATTLVSNFVLPLDADSLWIGDSRVNVTTNRPWREPVRRDAIVVLRKGTAALGLRVPWSRGLDGHAAPAALVYDGNGLGAVRFAVEHVAAAQVPKPSPLAAGAAFWVRIADGLKTDAAFTDWRRRFAADPAQVDVQPTRLSLRVAGTEGPVSVTAAAPWAAPASLDPQPTRSPLELDGQDLSRKLLPDFTAAAGQPLAR